MFDRLAKRALEVAQARVRRVTQDGLTLDTAEEDERAALARALRAQVDFGPQEATGLVGAVANHNARQLRRSVGEALEEEEPPSTVRPSQRPPKRGPRLRAVRPGDADRSLTIQIPELSRANVRRHARRTVREIQGIADAVAERLAPVVTRAVAGGVRGEVLARELERRLGLERKTAVRKAIGQVIRINSEITRERHEQLGITEYIWRAVDDAHTRDWHRKLNRTRQRYDSPPLGGGGGPKDYGHPGSADVCRCQAIPVMEAARPTPSP